MAVLVRIVIKRLAFVFDFDSFESVYFPEVCCTIRYFDNIG